MNSPSNEQPKRFIVPGSAMSLDTCIIQEKEKQMEPAEAIPISANTAALLEDVEVPMDITTLSVSTFNYIQNMNVDRPG